MKHIVDIPEQGLSMELDTLWNSNLYIEFTIEGFYDYRNEIDPDASRGICDHVTELNIILLVIKSHQSKIQASSRKKENYR